MIADDPAHTLDVLGKSGHQYKSQAVILIEIKPYNPALLIKLHDTLERAGVSILSSHLCSCDADVLSIAVLTTDNAVAFRAIQQAQHFLEADQCTSNAVATIHVWRPTKTEGEVPT